MGEALGSDEAGAGAIGMNVASGSGDGEGDAAGAGPAAVVARRTSVTMNERITGRRYNAAPRLSTERYARRLTTA